MINEREGIVKFYKDIKDSFLESPEKTIDEWIERTQKLGRARKLTAQIVRAREVNDRKIMTTDLSISMYEMNKNEHAGLMYLLGLLSDEDLDNLIVKLGDI